MKSFSWLLTAMLTLSTIGVGQTKKTESDLQTVMIKVPTVVCNSCAKTISSAVKKVEGVKSVSVDAEKKVAMVKYNPTKATLASLEKAIADAGYNANDTKRNQEAYEKISECCKIDVDEEE
ncbi:MAG: heavy-metal-associated domain-containing protein [Ignavibacteria bacterium]|nr:heavy-metal-associated domain-containing protein [Ignavibacteria bacterium]